MGFAAVNFLIWNKLPKAFPPMAEKAIFGEHGKVCRYKGFQPTDLRNKGKLQEYFIVDLSSLLFFIPAR